jgi:hypothetical protein
MPKFDDWGHEWKKKKERKKEKEETKLKGKHTHKIKRQESEIPSLSVSMIKPLVKENVIEIIVFLND